MLGVSGKWGWNFGVGKMCRWVHGGMLVDEG